jgi:KDO2-lipid IV(A) lauroyltransferase
MLRWFLFKLFFFYPRVYAFFCYYRKKGRRREIEGKLDFFLKKRCGLEKKRRTVRYIFELRGSRKMMRYMIPLMNPRFIKQFVSVEGLHHLDQALNEGRGVVLMAGHLGNPHLSFNALRVMGYDVIVLKGGIPRKARYPRFKYYDSFERTVFVHDPSVPREEKKGRILEVLRTGRIIYHPADAPEGRIKGTAFLLGKEVGFPTGVLHFAHQAQARIIPFIHLYQGGKITLILKEPIDGLWTEGKREYGRILTEFAKLLETYILTYPEQYGGFYGPTVLSDHYQSQRMPEKEATDTLEE